MAVQNINVNDTHELVYSIPLNVDVTINTLLVVNIKSQDKYCDYIVKLFVPTYNNNNKEFVLEKLSEYSYVVTNEIVSDVYQYKHIGYAENTTRVYYNTIEFVRYLCTYPQMIRFIDYGYVTVSSGDVVYIKLSARPYIKVDSDADIVEVDPYFDKMLISVLDNNNNILNTYTLQFKVNEVSTRSIVITVPSNGTKLWLRGFQYSGGANVFLMPCESGVDVGPVTIHKLNQLQMPDVLKTYFQKQSFVELLTLSVTELIDGKTLTNFEWLDLLFPHHKSGYQSYAVLVPEFILKLLGIYENDYSDGVEYKFYLALPSSQTVLSIFIYKTFSNYSAASETNDEIIIQHVKNFNTLHNTTNSLIESTSTINGVELVRISGGNVLAKKDVNAYIQPFSTQFFNYTVTLNYDAKTMIANDIDVTFGKYDQSTNTWHIYLNVKTSNIDVIPTGLNLEIVYNQNGYVLFKLKNLTNGNVITSGTYTVNITYKANQVVRSLLDIRKNITYSFSKAVLAVDSPDITGDIGGFALLPNGLLYYTVETQTGVSLYSYDYFYNLIRKELSEEMINFRGVLKLKLTITRDNIYINTTLMIDLKQMTVKSIDLTRYVNQTSTDYTLLFYLLNIGADENVYFSPCALDSYLMLNPKTFEFTKIGPRMTSNWGTYAIVSNLQLTYICPNNYKYFIEIDKSGVQRLYYIPDASIQTLLFLSDVNNSIYTIGYNGNILIKFSTVTKQYTKLTLPTSDSAKTHGGVVGINGMFYTVPLNVGYFLIVNPYTDSITSWTANSNFTQSPCGVLLYDGKIYYLLRDAAGKPYICVLEPSVSTKELQRIMLLFNIDPYELQKTYC